MKITKLDQRRKFLLAAGLGGAGAAAVAVTRGGTKFAGAAAETRKPTGYHVSEHILKYYKTTEV